MFLANIIWSLILTLKKQVPDNSSDVEWLKSQSTIVKNNEIAMWDSIAAIGKKYQIAQSKIDSFTQTAAQHSKKLQSYEKQLMDIKIGMKKTNYQDSSKTAILKTLPR